MGMMKIIANVGRKFRTAAMKKVRPKTFGPKPPAIKKQYQMESDWETEGNPAHAYVKKASSRSSSKPPRITFKGQDMQERNFFKSHKMVGGYKYGTIVSKEAYRTGKDKAVKDSYGSKGFKNYKTRSYQP